MIYCIKYLSLYKIMAKSQKIYNFLLYYSTILSTLISVIGFFTSKTANFFIANILFLPVTLTLWVLVISGFLKNNPNS